MQHLSPEWAVPTRLIAAKIANTTTMRSEVLFIEDSLV
jgi:hypothetical protein